MSGLAGPDAGTSDLVPADSKGADRFHDRLQGLLLTQVLTAAFQEWSRQHGHPVHLVVKASAAGLQIDLGVADAAPSQTDAWLDAIVERLRLAEEMVVLNDQIPHLEAMGVPQEQIQLLLARGREIMVRLFPGFDNAPPTPSTKAPG